VSLDLWIRRQGTNTVHVFSSEFEAGLYQTLIMNFISGIDFCYNIDWFKKGNYIQIPVGVIGI